MAELSEDQLLLLDNFMYISGSTTVGMDAKTAAKEILANGVKESDLSGGITVDQANEILNEIINDPTVGKLKITESVNTAGVRASCFVDNNGDATVAFRGTGGSYEAWSDNLKGEYIEDTPCQIAAANFINENCGKYDNITVTGHSKGGNMAQYCTVVAGDKIDRCVSYDGQGFDNDFLEKYSDEIDANSDKISSVCCNSDYVNILLNPIAGSYKYLETEDGANPHSSWKLYTKNKGTVEDGVYTQNVEQTESTQKLKKILSGATNFLSLLPENKEEGIVDILASDVGLVFAIISGQMSFDVFWNFLADHTNGWLKKRFTVEYWLFKKLYMAISSSSTEVCEVSADTLRSCKIQEIEILNFAASFRVKPVELSEYADELSTFENSLSENYIKLNNIHFLESLSLTGNINKRIKTLTEQVNSEQKMMGLYRKALEDCITIFNDTENQIIKTNFG